MVFYKQIILLKTWVIGAENNPNPRSKFEAEHESDLRFNLSNLEKRIRENFKVCKFKNLW
jgi:hypothetical protein